MSPRVTVFTPTHPKGIIVTTTTTTTYPPLGITIHEAAALTPFQIRVFHVLAQVPPGRVTTYGAIARVLRTSPRAVGNALRNNPYAPRVPCHRCVAGSGYVNGYDGEVVQRASFKGAAGGRGVAGKASQSRAAKVGLVVKTHPPSGLNVQRKLDLLKAEGVSFDDKGMLQNKSKVLFEGPFEEPWDLAAGLPL